VCEYKVVEADLTAEKLVHVDFVSIERAIENLSN
jgi:hypothetical protein